MAELCSDPPGVGTRRHPIGEPPGLKGWRMRVWMLRGRGLAPEDRRAKGIGREDASGWRQDRADTGSEGTLVRGDAGSEQHLAGEGVSGMPGPSARRHSPAAALAWPATHLASSSSGVSGHFAAKCAVTDLDAVAVLAPSRASHSATERRSSRGALADAARAIARCGKREAPRFGPLLPVPRRPLPVGGAAVRYSAGRGRAHAWPARSRDAVGGAPGWTPASLRSQGRGEDARRVRRGGFGEPGLPFQSTSGWSCPRPAGQGALGESQFSR